MMSLRLLNSVMRLHESNIRILHWNSAGEEFNDAHKSITEEYYELLADNIDKVSEIMGMLDIMPPNYVEVVAIIKSTNRDYTLLNGNKLYNRAEIIDNIDNFFLDITELIGIVLEEDIIKAPENVGIKAELENIMYTFDFQRRYINKRRSM